MDLIVKQDECIYDGYYAIMDIFINEKPGFFQLFCAGYFCLMLKILTCFVLCYHRYTIKIQDYHTIYYYMSRLTEVSNCLG